MLIHEKLVTLLLASLVLTRWVLEEPSPVKGLSAVSIETPERPLLDQSGSDLVGRPEWTNQKLFYWSFGSSGTDQNLRPISPASLCSAGGDGDVDQSERTDGGPTPC